jgi:hypothetical protein
MTGWLIVVTFGAFLLFSAYCIIRILLTLHHEEFTDPEL